MFKLCVFFFCVSLAFSETVKVVSEEDYFAKSKSIEERSYFDSASSGDGMEVMDDGSGLFGETEQFSTTVSTTTVSKTVSTTIASTTTTTPAPMTTFAPTTTSEKRLDISSK